jgi:hypothetical protein
MTTSLIPQASKMEEEAHLPTMEAKEKGALYSPPCIPTREWWQLLGTMSFTMVKEKLLSSWTRIGRSYSRTLVSTIAKTCMLNSLQEKAFPYLFLITHLRQRSNTSYQKRREEKRREEKRKEEKRREEKRLSDLDSFIQKYTRLLGTVNRQLDNTSLTDIEEEQLISKQIGLEEKIASLTTSKITKPPVVLHGKELTAYLSASKKYTDRCDRLTTDRAKAYELIKGQWTSRLMNKLEKESSWTYIQHQKDPLKLFSLIEKSTLSHTDDTYYYQA